MAVVFFSYSHLDEAMRNELEVHLAPLKRQGAIATWHDRCIIAGDEWGKEIDHYLEIADIILLLISPYFIASDYCYDIEMTRALERHEQGSARVIPVILEPCDWQSMPFGKLQSVPTNGKPISKFPNQHDGFLEVAQAIRKAAGTPQIAPPNSSPQLRATSPEQAPIVSRPRSSNLRIQQSFSDHDRDTFLEETFEYMANFFEGSLTELEKRNTGINTRFKRVDANHFSAVIYKNGKTASECRIWTGGLGMGGFSRSSAIYFSFGASGLGNGFNESMSVVEDGQMLLLKPMGMQRYGSQQEKALSQHGAAEYFWDMLIEPLQR